ncbi:hypothetical protein QBC34DRAFT_298403 [Podospora aff. communis PSN243]|uniref:NACHT domain-containing protein n=1 Tax=Podospora aff. communis PSN243 TaxID=3040156 RepID=A0AAV9GMG4_9PEZI|nr:hypothetical protein QBC34DRAFT_298403 [Podospora aff. communis PSN243]
MDPLSAIGLVGNIVSLIDSGLRFVDAARSVYRSATGTTAENENLAFVAAEVQKRALTIQSKEYSSPPANGDDEQSLEAIARKCRSISEELLGLLGTLQATQRKSVKSSVTAIWKNFRAKKKKEALSAQMEALATQLQHQLACVTQSKTVAQLEDLVAVAGENSATLSQLQTQIEKLRTGIDVTFLHPDLVKQLQVVLDASDGLMFKRRKAMIRQALDAPELGSRFFEVSDAHPTTFDWILADTAMEDKVPETTHDVSQKDWNAWGSDDDPDWATTEEQRQRLRQREAAARFVAWLKYGRDFFHITGKPGAGKSTLMKFLFKDRRSFNYLRHWAKDAGKSLVTAFFFFWREGAASQRTLRGLRRGLLFNLLDAAPDLIPVAFPDLWELTTGGGLKLATITDDQVEQSFNQVISDRKTYASRRFVFFIDGLDEFEGDYTEQTKMLRHLHHWVETGDGELKICVSSREYNIFLDNFSASPKLRLQDLTFHDMRLLVSGRLRAHGQYQARLPELNFLERRIVMKAEGVFLWVHLVLNAIEESLSDGADTEALRETLELLPSDLEKLFEKFFASISPSSLPSALQTFSVVLCQPISHDPGELCLYLRCYPFIDLYLKDRDFATKIKPQPLTDQEVEEALALSRRRLRGRCKGFLEVRNHVNLRRSGNDFPPFREYITTTHRSVVEYLRGKCSTISDAIACDGLFQCYLAMFKTMDAALDIPYFRDFDNRFNFVKDFDEILLWASRVCLSLRIGSKVVFARFHAHRIFLAKTTGYLFSRAKARLVNGPRVLSPTPWASIASQS